MRFHPEMISTPALAKPPAPVRPAPVPLLSSKVSIPKFDADLKSPSFVPSTKNVIIGDDSQTAANEAIRKMRELFLARKRKLVLLHTETFFHEAKFHNEQRALFQKQERVIAGCDDDEIGNDKFDYDDPVFMGPEKYRTPTGTPTIPDGRSQKLDRGQATMFANYWLVVLNNINNVTGLIQPGDTNLLEYLTNIGLKYFLDPPGYRLEFCFAPNPYFKNDMLTKDYFLRLDYPLAADLALHTCIEIDRCVGTRILWKENRFLGVTHKFVHVDGPEDATESQTTENPDGIERAKGNLFERKPSFFHFFTPSEEKLGSLPGFIPDYVEELLQLQQDVKIGNYFRSYVIPSAPMIYAREFTEDDNQKAFR